MSAYICEQIELTNQIIGCLIDALADDEGRIDMKCFEKICNALIKAGFVAGKVGDLAVNALKDIFRQVELIRTNGDAFQVL
jgi:hypothetical protein